jgi:plastocyanin
MRTGVPVKAGLFALTAGLVVLVALTVSHPARAMHVLQQATGTLTSTPAGTSTVTLTSTPVGTATATSPPLAAYPVVFVNVVHTAHVSGGYAFQPKRVTVRAGSIVLWQNTSNRAVTITSRTRGWTFDKRLKAHGKVTALFTKAGTYRYYSKLRPSMTGRIVVTP